MLDVEHIEKSVVVRFTRPEIRNPLSVSVLAAIDRMINELSVETAAIIFTGTGDVFASGADLREIADVAAEDAREFAERGQRLMNRVASLQQSTIAAINGYCFGGALDLALACNRRIASPSASFAHPGTGLGIITGWGGTQRLPRLIGQADAMEMFFTAGPIGAEHALGIGLIDEIADDALATSLAYSERETSSYLSSVS
jgi:enoyl-CoA hydratase